MLFQGYFSVRPFLPLQYHVEYLLQWQKDVPPERGKTEKTCCSLEDKITLTREILNTETLYFVLFNCPQETLIFTVRSQALKTQQAIFWNYGCCCVALYIYLSSCLSMKMRLVVKSWWQWVTHWVDVHFKCINENKWFAHIGQLPVDFFVNDSFNREHFS